MSTYQMAQAARLEPRQTIHDLHAEIETALQEGRHAEACRIENELMDYLDTFDGLSTAYRTGGAA